MTDYAAMYRCDGEDGQRALLDEREFPTYVPPELLADSDDELRPVN